MRRMYPRAWPKAVVAVLVTLACTTLVVLEGSGRSVAAQDAATPYRPSMSDLMIETIQPRHIKLWISGRSANWTYAAYEIRELRGAFSRFARTYPTSGTIPIGAMTQSVTAQPFADLTKAIGAHDVPAFNAAYQALTSGCNACHQAVGHGAVVIQTPQQASFPDQNFAPQQP